MNLCNAEAVRRARPAALGRLACPLAFMAALAAAGVAHAQTVSFTEYQVPTANSYPYAIVNGPDGALWFTEINGSKIARVTTTGSITEYPIPAAGSSGR